MVKLSNASPVTPEVIECKTILEDKIKQNSCTNHFKNNSLIGSKIAKGLVSLSVPRQVDAVGANGHDALKQDTFTPSDTSGCRAENIFGNVHSNKLKQVTPV